MKRFLVILLAGMLLLSACGPKGEGVQAGNFWMRSGLKDGNSATYMMLTNFTDSDVALLGASSDVAAAVEIHLSSVGADGTMKMEKQDSVGIPAGAVLELKPGSYHIMFIGLTKDLAVGDEITLTLHFDGYDDLTLTVPVKDAADMGGSGMEGMP
ncbi:MAG: copper chaperone PCu(A)C [Chloroflexi bacterium]|nr:copper chaperone PCu(A)C [Chloroflexota bacterium]MBI3170776.1 copper chaperone PCu(A)C [Chloroflexota bacterium]